MINNDIEVGFKLKSHLYLTICDGEYTVPFDIDSIVDVVDDKDGTIVEMAEVFEPFSSKKEIFKYKVKEDYKKVRETIDDTRALKAKWLDIIKMTLE